MLIINEMVSLHWALLSRLSLQFFLVMLFILLLPLISALVITLDVIKQILNLINNSLSLFIAHSLMDKITYYGYVDTSSNLVERIQTRRRIMVLYQFWVLKLVGSNPIVLL